MYDPANSNQPGLSVNMFKKLPTVKIILPSEMTNEHGCIFAGDFAISLTMSLCASCVIHTRRVNSGTLKYYCEVEMFELLFMEISVKKGYII